MRLPPQDIDRIIVILRRDGEFTYEAIGHALGMHRERVRKIYLGRGQPKPEPNTPASFYHDERFGNTAPGIQGRKESKCPSQKRAPTAGQTTKSSWPTITKPSSKGL